MKYYVLIFCLFGLLVGCDTIVEVENLPSRVTSVGPINARGNVQDGGTSSPTQLQLLYTIRDYEGDDARLSFELCEGEPNDEGSNCFTAVQGNLSDGTARVPTAPYDTDVPHQFRWEVGCGVVDGDARRPVEVDVEHLFRVSVAGQEDSGVTSNTFTLEDFGFTDQVELDCTQ